MHSDQVRIDTVVARRMIADQFPQYRDLPVRRLPQLGTVNAIFRIGDAAAARFPLRPLVSGPGDERLQAEAAAMAEFAALAPVPAPAPIGVGRPGPEYPMAWSVQSWVEGDAATPTGLAASTDFAGDIADLIAALRTADTRGRRFDGGGRGGHLPDHDGWIAECLRNSTGLLDVPALRRMWDRLRQLPESGPEVMSHRDLIPMNLLTRGERLVGVIDTAGFGPADPALDLVAAWHLFDPPGRRLIRDRLGTGDVEWRRSAAWAFQQAMGLVWYYRETNRPMSALGTVTLARLLEDPELQP